MGFRSYKVVASRLKREGFLGGCFPGGPPKPYLGVKIRSPGTFAFCQLAQKPPVCQRAVAAIMRWNPCAGSELFQVFSRFIVPCCIPEVFVIGLCGSVAFAGAKFATRQFSGAVTNP
jgi:hypothetical protein